MIKKDHYNLYVCQCVYLSIRRSYLPIYLSIFIWHPSIHSFDNLCFHPSIHPSIHLCIHSFNSLLSFLLIVVFLFHFSLIYYITHHVIIEFFQTQILSFVAQTVTLIYDHHLILVIVCTYRRQGIIYIGYLDRYYWTVLTLEDVNIEVV